MTYQCRACDQVFSAARLCPSGNIPGHGERWESCAGSYQPARETGRGWRVEYRGVLQSVVREFPTWDAARTWARQVGKSDARIVPVLESDRRGEAPTP